jgi:DNA repair protein RadC
MPANKTINTKAFRLSHLFQPHVIPLYTSDKTELSSILSKHSKPSNMKTQIPLLQAVGEVSLSYTKNHIVLPNSPISSSSDAYNAFQAIFHPSTLAHREFMYAMYLSRSNNILGYAQISSGGLSGTVCDPKIVFQYALKLNASGIILAHNHPSGNLKPSRSDLELTEKIQKGGKLLDITLLDHLIVSENGYWSWADS